MPRDPDGKLTDWTDVAQLDFGNPGVRREAIAAMRWWLQEFGIDGYRVDVVEFVDSAHTPRNLLLRARRTGVAGPRDDYDALTAQWGVTPALATMLS